MTEKKKNPTWYPVNRSLAGLKQVNYKCTCIEKYLISDKVLTIQLKQSVYFIRLRGINEQEAQC